jgi:hypothetical protein
MIERENSSPSAEKREAANILKQVERDSQSIVFGGLPSATNPADDADAGDRIEFWGQRIGRTLGIVGAVIAVFWLLFSLG